MPSASKPEPLETGVPVLEAAALHKRYRSGNTDIHVLKGVSLQVLPGQSLSIRGVSGSGKTTLLNLLSGLEAPDTGTVCVQGAPLGVGPNAPLRRSAQVGMVFQSPYLVAELTVEANVLIAARIARKPLAEARARCRALLEALGLSERRKHLPGQLSGGERQRVALARALLNRPPLVLADEPTGNLDEVTGQVVMEQLLALVRTEACALILVTHDAAFAARCQRQYRLQEGVLVEGTPAAGSTPGAGRTD